MNFTKTSLLALSVVLLSTGCSSKEELVNSINNEDIIMNNANIDKINSLQLEIFNLKSKLTEVNKNSKSRNFLTPPNAKSGECYARVLIPAKYGYNTTKIEVANAGNDVEVTPATYGYEEKRVTLREHSYKTKIIPATYKFITKKVLVKPEIVSFKKVPAKFKINEIKILTSAAYTTWKKGRGEIEKIDSATGEILCKIDVPAKYQTIEKKVLVADARVEKVITPAVYRDIKTKILDKPESCVKTKIPAIIKVYKVRKIINEPKVKLVQTTKPVFKTIKSKYLLSDSSLAWKEILCETNTNKDIIASIQAKLQDLKLYDGKIDGDYGSETKNAIKKFQENNKLSTGALTIDTLKKLGLK